MNKSLGEACAGGVPVVFTSATGEIPEVVCEPGKECQALETLAKMGLIKLRRPVNPRQPKGTIRVYSEEIYLNDDDLLEANGWMIECRSPFEISHHDGSRATGMAAQIVIGELRAVEDEDTKANRQT